MRSPPESVSSVGTARIVSFAFQPNPRVSTTPPCRPAGCAAHITAVYLTADGVSVTYTVIAAGQARWLLIFNSDLAEFPRREYIPRRAPAATNREQHTRPGIRSSSATVNGRPAAGQASAQVTAARDAAHTPAWQDPQHAIAPRGGRYRPADRAAGRGPAAQRADGGHHLLPAPEQVTDMHSVAIRMDL
jgi:hypothetical protein